MSCLLYITYLLFGTAWDWFINGLVFNDKQQYRCDFLSHRLVYSITCLSRYFTGSVSTLYVVVINEQCFDMSRPQLWQFYLSDTTSASPLNLSLVPFFFTTADEKPCLSDLQYMACTNEEGRDFRLIDRVKTYWWNLAVALKFPSNEIASMEHKDDNSRVHYIFHEWLRGANHDKDSKPVTWATLITALKNANIQQEAKILEEHFVEMPHSG